MKWVDTTINLISINYENWQVSLYLEDGVTLPKILVFPQGPYGYNSIIIRFKMSEGYHAKHR